MTEFMKATLDAARVTIAVRADLHKRLSRRAKYEGKTIQFFAEQSIAFALANMGLDGKPKLTR